ncbi:2OG-Fe dioxygenase family protein [Pelomonas sp. SE-A7]|uniref:2OG-Fe dioxygenase family protein n=1 Tax=Pelomonas sp. SE-A7 TaxID=3054953 RepID=UPI00259C97ED|nr:2OG-Fe dioxygenase family protein [Pelomonas sp. SE-A7]MDM4765446.1 2OG-Fe dioxygenase family protein [Pelomonas sp. SE-A7]
MFTPPYVDPAQCADQLKRLGHAVLAPASLVETLGCSSAELAGLAAFWKNLPTDQYLKDGGRYRFRRHSSFVVAGESVSQCPHRPHWQPVDYNALHGGIERMFEPMQAEAVALPAWRKLLRGLGGIASSLKGAKPWFVEAHQFRIDTTDGIGRPTPEGAHRDGVDLVAVFLIQRHQIKGGESRVFEAAGPQGQRFTMTEPWTLLLLDDERVIHETTPIQPDGGHGHRDTLVVTLRSGGFQDP